MFESASVSEIRASSPERRSRSSMLPRINPPVERPLKELKGFQKVYLKPGESKKVTITLDRRSLAYYNVTKRDMGCCPRSVLDSGRLFLAGHRVAKATGELVPIVALGLGEFAGAGSKTPHRTGIDWPRRSWQGSRARNARSKGQGRRRGRTPYTAGTIVKVTADPPSAREEVCGLEW